MNKQELLNNKWTITRHFHNEECVYYYTAEKGRDILTSADGITFGGLLNGEWV